MADILPFVATRYNAEQNGNLDNLVTPPYDVIDKKLQQDLYDRDPHNLVRVDFGKDQPGDDEGENRYSRAEAVWKQWKQEGVLAEDPKKAFYVYEQEFAMPDGSTVARRGFFAAVRLQDFSEGGIRAHERTFDGPKADRFRLMRATGCNLSPIFCLFDDPTKNIDALLRQGTEGQAPIECRFDDVVHRLWIVSDPAVVNPMIEQMADKTLFIADGHHRYETSLLYRDEMRSVIGKSDGKQPYDYTLMYLNNTHDDGLVVLPTHRVLTRESCLGVDYDELVQDIEEYFDMTPVEVNGKDPQAEAVRLMDLLGKAGEKGPSFVMVLPKFRTYVLTLKADADLDDLLDDTETPREIKELDVTILHQFIINRALLGNPEIELDHDDVHYYKDAAAVLDCMCHAKHGCSFLMNPTRVDQVTAVAHLGLRMPHKSTYFYPKLITGLVIRDMASPW